MVSISSFFYLELWLRPDGTLNVERIVLSLVCSKDCRCHANLEFFQVLESEVQTSQNAEGCPYPVDRRCPHAGTGSSGSSFETSREQRGWFE